MSNTAESDLQILDDMPDRALYIRIKVNHPLWSDELVKKEIENLRSAEFAEWYRDLIQSVQEKQK